MGGKRYKQREVMGEMLELSPPTGIERFVIRDWHCSLGRLSWLKLEFTESQPMLGSHGPVEDCGVRWPWVARPMALRMHPTLFVL